MNYKLSLYLRSKPFQSIHSGPVWLSEEAIKDISSKYGTPALPSLEEIEQIFYEVKPLTNQEANINIGPYYKRIATAINSRLKGEGK